MALRHRLDHLSSPARLGLQVTLRMPQRRHALPLVSGAVLESGSPYCSLGKCPLLSSGLLGFPGGGRDGLNSSGL